MGDNPEPVKLHDLQLGTKNVMITAIIIAKSRATFFMGKDNTSHRGVISFTVRDSSKSIVNCKIWDTQEQIAMYMHSFKIGDIVNIVRPAVLAHPLTTASKRSVEMFYPTPTLPIILVLNDKSGQLTEYNSCNDEMCCALKQLLRSPHKPICNALQLSDVRSNSFERNVKGQYVDLLVLIAVKKPLRQFQKGAQKNSNVQNLELVVYDKSHLDGMIMSIWHSEWIERAQLYWLPHKTILHLTDVKVVYSEYHKANKLNFAESTLVFENPLGEEAEQLQVLAQKMAMKDIDILAQADASSLPKADEITTPMTVRQIYARTETQLGEYVEEFTAVVHGMITKFDIDGLAPVLSIKCKSCQRFIPRAIKECQAEECQLAFSLNRNENEKVEEFFNINVHITDYTGTLVEARLTGAVAERTLGKSVQEYCALDMDSLERLKMRFLLQLFVVKLLIKKVTAVRRSTTIIVIEMRPVPLGEYRENVRIF